MTRLNLTSRMEGRFGNLIAVATLVTTLYYIFHLTLTSPMDIPSSFVLVFVYAFISAFFIGKDMISLFFAGLLFSLLKLFTNIMAIVFNLSGFTVLTTNGGNINLFGLVLQVNWSFPVLSMLYIMILFVVNIVIFMFGAIIVKWGQGK